MGACALRPTIVDEVGEDLLPGEHLTEVLRGIDAILCETTGLLCDAQDQYLLIWLGGEEEGDLCGMTRGTRPRGRDEEPFWRPLPLGLSTPTDHDGSRGGEAHHLIDDRVEECLGAVSSLCGP